MIAAFNKQDEGVPLGLARSILRGEINRFRSNPNHMGTKWNDTLTFNITLFKNLCDDKDNLVFTEEEIDDINAWLTSPDYPLLFHMYDYDTVDTSGNPVNKKYDYFGLFTDVSPISVGEEIIGLQYMFITNSPFAWTEQKTATFHCEEETEFVVVVDHSERNREVYPIIVIDPSNDYEQGEEIEIRIKQMTDNGKTLIMNLDKSPTTIDCRRSMIYNASGRLTFEDLHIDNIDWIYWPKLYDGRNRIIVSGNCDVTFKWREARKVGAY